MTGSPQFPFSDLTQVEVEMLMRAARVERAQAIRSLFVGLWSVAGRREAHVWRPKTAPALSLTACR